MSQHFIVHREAFHEVLGADPRFFTLIETDAHEGPVYVREEHALYFTSVPQGSNVPLPGFQRVAIKRVPLAGGPYPLPSSAAVTLRDDANMANGMTLDRDGGLLVCEQGSKAQPARIARLDRGSGALETVVDQWRGLRFNSPNDVVMKSDGSIWFTDPAYGALQGFKDAPLLGNFVYRYEPRTGSLSVVADDFDKPNGLAFSPDESVLYITDSGAIQGPGSYFVERPHHIRAFDVRDGRQLTNGRLFAVVSPGIPDGIKLDSAGRVYSSSASGVQVFDPCGDLLGEIVAPGVANFCFGGEGNDTLFMLADTVIWAARLQARGAA